MKKLIITTLIIILIPFIIVTIFIKDETIKFNFISNSVVRVKRENVMPAVKNAIAQDKIFEAQLQNYINKPVPSVAILNAFPLFIYDYFKV